MLDSRKESFDLSKGFKVGLRGLPDSLNPYKEGTPDWISWGNGHAAGTDRRSEGEIPCEDD
jgi:hypothetical protein